MASSQRHEMMIGLGSQQSQSMDSIMDDNDFSGLAKGDLSAIHSPNSGKNGCFGKMQDKCCGCKKSKHKTHKGKKKKKKDKKKKENRPKKISILFMKVIQRSFSILDLFTDIALARQFQKDENEMIYAFVFIVISICAPYLISYSSGVKLFMSRGTFENSEGFFYILTNLFITPIGVLYFVFIDFVDALLVGVDFISMVIFGMNENQLKQRQRLWARQIGMDRMAWEGFKRQRVVGQLSFESIPQLILQSLLAFELINLNSLRTCDDNGVAPTKSCQGSDATFEDDSRLVIFSIITTSCNIIFQMGRLIAESIAVEERIDQYALNCIMARVGWTPYKHKIERFREDSDYKVKRISYDIKFPLWIFTDCTGIRGSVDFAFSDVTLGQLSAAISLLDKKSDNRDPRMKLFLHHSCDLVPCHEMVSLMWNCKDKVKLSDITRFDWNGSIDLAAKDGKDIRIKQYSYIGDRIPLLVAILECNFDSKLKIFQTFLKRGVCVCVCVCVCFLCFVLFCFVLACFSPLQICFGIDTFFEFC